MVCFEYVLEILCPLADVRTERQFLYHSTNLLLELTSRSPDFNRPVFDDPLSECKFEVQTFPLITRFNVFIDSSHALASCVIGLLLHAIYTSLYHCVLVNVFHSLLYLVFIAIGIHRAGYFMATETLSDDSCVCLSYSRNG